MPPFFISWSNAIRMLPGFLVLIALNLPAANLQWTTSSSSLAEGAGTWNQGVASLPSGAPWYNGSTYNNLMQNGDTVTFGGGASGTGGTIVNGTTLAPAKIIFLTPFSTATFYTIGTNGFNSGGTASLPNNPINLNGGVITNGSSGGATISCPVNGSFTYYASTSKINFNGDGNQTGADTINLQLGTLQIGANAGQRGSFGSAKINNNGQVVWRRGSLAGGFIVSNAISGSGSVQYQLNTATFIILSNQTYTGSTIMTPSGSAAGNNSVLKLGANDVLPTNTDFAINQTAGTLSTSTFDLNGQNQTLGSLASDVNATLTATVVTNSSITVGTLTLAGTGKTKFYNGNIAGNLNLALTGSGSTFTLSNACTYTGITTIGAGTLALGGAGSIAGSSLISVAGGATMDVSGLSSYTLSLGQILSNSASATGTIKGNLNTASGAVSVSFASSPALVVSNGTLTLSVSTSFTVNNTNGPFGLGTYKIISKGAGGLVAGSAPSVSTPGNISSLSISNGELYLVVSAVLIPTTTGLTLSSGSNPSTLGSALMFQAAVSPAPANGSVITFLDGTNTLGTGTTTTGVATFSTNGLTVGSHSITASVGGDASYGGSVSSPFIQIVNWVGPTLSDSNLFAALNLNYPGLELVKTNVTAANYTAAKTNLTNYLRTRTNVNWYFDPRQVTNTVGYSLSSANNTVIGNVSVVGISYTFANSNIDWLYNVTLDTNYNYTDNSEWQWQLNRMVFWPNLGDTYWGTGNELYPQTWVVQMEDWFNQCPVPATKQNGVGSPWRTLEAGIRMTDIWPNTFFRCLTSPSFGSESVVHYLKSCVEHARYLKLYPTASGNWVTTEQMGLFTVGSLFPELNESTNWRSASIQQLYNYQTNQFYPDGAELELTPNYDLISQGNLLNLYNLADLEGRTGELPPNYVANLENSFAYSMWLLAPDGTLPQFNDCINSRSGVDNLQTGYSLYPNRTDFLYAATFGASGTPPAQTSYSFPYAGYNVMRSGWSNAANYLCFDASPLGLAHQHNDALNVVLWAWGRELLFDSGGGEYTTGSLWRNYGLSSASHNTVMVDGQDQFGGVSGIQTTASMTDPDYISQSPRAMRWEDSLTHNFAASTYNRGYGSYNNRPATHARRVLFVQPDIYLIADTLVPTNTASHSYEARWHLLPTTTKLDAATKVISTTNAGLANLAIVPCLQSNLTVTSVVGQSNGPSATQLAGWNITAGQPGYASCTTVKHSLSATGTNQFLTLLLPLAGGKTNPVSAVVSTGPNSARVDLTDGRKFYVSADPNSAGNLQFTEVLANGTTNRNISSGLGVPSISQLPDRFMAKNTTLGPVGFTVGISSGSASNLILSGHSANQSLVTDGNINFGGSGTNRAMTITPVANALGTTAINVTATTPGGGTVMDSFQLTVIAPPTLAVSNFTLAGGNLTLTWPTNFIGWSLQTQTNGINSGLGTNWTTISSSINTNVMVMPINQTSGSVFYRLTYP